METEIEEPQPTRGKRSKNKTPTIKTSVKNTPGAYAQSETFF
jgi:hypothetical protein